jgi:hypothetical protein
MCNKENKMTQRKSDLSEHFKIMGDRLKAQKILILNTHETKNSI